jgi:SAM-dependent methyltransferase
MDNPVYALGHSDGELERLIVQSRFVEPITRRFFQEAGISAGMRVLDIGSGAGDVAFLAADLVGETGEVVGTDKSAAALATAKQRAAVAADINFPAQIAVRRLANTVVRTSKGRRSSPAGTSTSSPLIKLDVESGVPSYGSMCGG